MWVWSVLRTGVGGLRTQVGLPAGSVCDAGGTRLPVEGKGLSGRVGHARLCAWCGAVRERMTFLGGLRALQKLGQTKELIRLADFDCISARH